MLNNFPDAMPFLQVFIRISIQFGGFSEQHQGSSRKISRKVFHVFAGKPSNSMSVVTLIFDVNKLLRVPVWQTNSYNWNFFPIEKFFLHENRWNRQYLSLFG